MPSIPLARRIRIFLLVRMPFIFERAIATGFGIGLSENYVGYLFKDVTTAWGPT